VKLHDLKPAPGSRTPKRRVGRGIAAGQGKTAGRGTKGQKSRAGGKIPAWFEGGQTPLHQRIPKLRGFRNPFKIEYEVVNLGDIARLVELGELEPGDMPGGSSKGSKGSAPITVNQEILRAAGLVRRLDRPMKVLGGGDLSTALFVVADAFSASAKSKIEGAGGTVSVLEVPQTKRKAMGVGDDASAAVETPTEPVSEAPAEAVAEAPAEDVAAEEPKPSRAKRGAAKAATDDASTEQAESALTPDETAAVEAALAESAPTAESTDAPADEAPAKPRASRKPKTPKPEADA
jgi:large subunit ribosomal protein L15